MIRKIISSIIVIMIIFSACVYGTNITTEENSPTDGQEAITPETDKKEETQDKVEENTNNNENIDKDNNASKEDEDTNGSNEDINQENNNPAIDKEESNESSIQQKPTNTVVAKKSSEARLRSLKVDVEGLSPEFDKDTIEYYLVVDLSVSQIKITAEVFHDKATYAVYGNKNLKKGENTITIQVTAEDGTKEKYYIYVTKVDNVELANAELESIKIEGFNLYPSFKSNIYTYNLNINESIKELPIEAIPQMEKATVDIQGNTDLQEGENLIKILVTAEDKTTVRTYKINTFINTDKVEIEEEDKMPAIVMLAVLGVGILISGTCIIVKNKK